jgi:4-amino-4-deoxy-L-arabinose transferase-like glycosyltransferase
MKKRYTIILLILLVLGIAARLFGAWAYRDCLNPDAGVVALMAKHITEGRTFPVFFYGQAYMGSLEPLVSAFCCRLLGISGFAVCLGTALFGILLLPVVYVWGRDAAGPKAGLVATAFLVLGPGGFFHYMGSPRGGYAATFLFGALLLWMGGRMLAQELSGKRSHWGWFLAMGIIAGLAWWTNQLITATLLTLVLLFVVLLHVRLFTWRIVPGIVGFFLGGLPFWVWNIRNDWGTFNFLNSFSRPNMLEGLLIFSKYRVFALLDLRLMPPAFRWLTAGFYAVVLIWAAASVLRMLRRRKWTAETIHLGLILVFFVVFALLFSVSHFAHFNTPRYLLPLIPPLAVLLGVATTRWGKRLKFGLAFLPVLLLIGYQAYTIVPGNIERGRAFDRRMADAYALGDFLRERGVHVAMGEYRFFSRNFILDEEFVFTQPTGDRYPPYAHAGERAARFVKLEDRDGLTRFVGTTDGHARRTKVGGIRILYDIKPPTLRPSPLPADCLRAIRDEAGRDVLEILADDHVDTAWSRLGTADGTLTLEFTEPTEVAGIRIVTHRGALYPHRIRIEGQAGVGAEWEQIQKERDLTYYFWSGPRPYCEGIHFRAVKQFEPRTLTRLRLYFPPWERTPEWEIAELDVLGRPAPRPDLRESEDELIMLLKERGINHLYSDRWIANVIHDRLFGQVRAETEPQIYPRKGCDIPNEIPLLSG